MKQILQSLRSGATEVAEVPRPGASAGHLLIATSRSLISAGTERMLVEFGKAGLLEKARQQPERVRMVLDKVRTDGIMPTIESVRNKLDQPLPLGYCNAGVVVEVGSGTTGFSVGDRVASNGQHAEVVRVPVNLCARIPDGVPAEAAAFTPLAAIALQGMRLAQPTLGEAVAVIGLGLIGQLAVQLLRAQGCRVLGIDLDANRLALARRWGAESVDVGGGADPVAAGLAFSRGRGMDAVLITAGTKSNEPVQQAARMSRQRGRIVLVGIAGLELSRDDFFRKELTFQVSASYGPGRYDPSYEDAGHDYPVGLVRWTEQRNFEAVLDMMADGRLETGPLVTNRFPIAEAARAYDLITGDQPSLGVVLEYPDPPPDLPARTVSVGGVRPATAAPAVGFIGAGNYAQGVLIPAFKAAGAHLHTVASGGGVTAQHAARRFGFTRSTTDVTALLGDPEVPVIVIATRHDSHASLVRKALAAGKHVFVEKPLCLTTEEADDLEALYRGLARGDRVPHLMVGFNRRFAPHVITMRDLLRRAPGPRSLVMTVNAGALPPDHWTLDPERGGGRIIGEGCHFVDLVRHLVGAAITGTHASYMEAATDDTATLVLRFADGSVGTVHYFANGNKRLAKERLEVFAGGRVLRLDNFRRLEGFGWDGLRRSRLWRQDKGQAACAAAFLEAVSRGGAAPIPVDELFEVSRATIALARR